MLTAGPKSFVQPLKEILYKHLLHFSSQPGVANENFENEPKSCLSVACFINDLYNTLSEN